MAFNWTKGATGALYGGIIPGIIAGNMPGYEDPSREANQYLGQIEGRVNPYYKPYIDQGNQVDPALREQYSQMMNDPNMLFSKLASGYNKSPGYDWRLKQGEGAISNAAAAGGMAGSQQHQQQSGQLAEDMASEDFNKYMDRVLGIFGGGQQGLEGISNRGFGASSSMADAIANILGTQAQYAYAGKAGENAANAADEKNLYGGLGSLTSAITSLF
jgi:hypothetical protein